MSEIKIKSYRVSKRGNRGLIISVPVVWCDDMKIKPGDVIDIYRDDQDRIILTKAEEQVRTK